MEKIDKIKTRSNVIPTLIIRLAILNLITAINKYRNQRDVYICKGRLLMQQFSVIICLSMVYLMTTSPAPINKQDPLSVPENGGHDFSD